MPTTNKNEHWVGTTTSKGNSTSPSSPGVLPEDPSPPLKVGDEVEVIGMPPEEECEHEMFVVMRWDREGLAVPLSQLEVIDADDETREAVEDWLYWSRKDYQF
jgi:hypothetical protein